MESVHDLREDTIDMLQRLIEGNIDAAKGFEEAAEQVDNPALAAAFVDTSRRRAGFADTLQNYVAHNGEHPEDDGTARGTVHRAWMKVRAALSSDDLSAMLDEAARGEHHLKGLYERLLVENPASPLSTVLHSQYASIRRDQEGIAGLREHVRN